MGRRYSCVLASVHQQIKRCLQLISFKMRHFCKCSGGLVMLAVLLGVVTISSAGLIQGEEESTDGKNAFVKKC